jgi:hypothetical protein
MPNAHRAIGLYSRTNRSRKTNGTSMFLGQVDGRSAISRRVRDLERGYLSSLPEPVTTAQRSLVSSLAAIQVRLELLQASIARGEVISDHELVRLSRAHRAALSDLGLTKPTEPKHRTLAEVLAEGRNTP